MMAAQCCACLPEVAVIVEIKHEGRRTEAHLCRRYQLLETFLPHLARHVDDAVLNITTQKLLSARLFLKATSDAFIINERTV